MQIVRNADLKDYTSIHIGGIANTMFIPESSQELVDLVINEKPIYYLGGGTNLLINDRVFDMVVCLKSHDKTIEYLGNGTFKVGSSVRLQSLINAINDRGFGGIEYLYSVPGLVGGALVMNAGRGIQYGKSISEYVLSVSALDHSGNIIDFNKSECQFSYRESIFKNSKYIILNALFKFPAMSKEETSEAKKDRVEHCKLQQDSRFPNFGSVFMLSNGTIMRLIKKMKIGNCRAQFSDRTANWLLNTDNASFNDAIDAIMKVERIHKILWKRSKREVIVWE